MNAFGAWLATHTSVIAIAISAAATVWIGVFTAVLSKISGRQTEIAVVAQRAFVFANGFNSFYERNAAGTEWNWRFRPVWINSGETPTRELTIYVDCELTNAPLTKSFDFNQTRLPPGTGFLGPKATNMGGAAPLPPRAAITPSDIADIQAGRKFLYLWGWARYRDRFPDSDRHVSRFCYAILPTGDPKIFDPNKPNPAAVTFPYNQWTFGNCADEECLAIGLG